MLSRRLLQGLRQAQRPVLQPRAFHTSQTVLKKGKAQAVVEDAFDDEAPVEDDDLFGSAASSTSTQSPAQEAPVVSPVAPNASQVNAANMSARATAFEKIRSNVLGELATPTASKIHRLRKHSLRQLIGLADDGEKLEHVAEVIEKARNARAAYLLHDSVTWDFLGRCINLRRSDIALKVLSERPKYGLDIPDVSVARDLMFTIYNRAVKTTPEEAERSANATPFTSSYSDDALLLASLYPIFRIGKVSEDPISSALLLRILISNPEQMDAAKELGEHLLQSVQERRVVLGEHVPARQHTWLRELLKTKKVRDRLLGWGFSQEILEVMKVPKLAVDGQYDLAT